MSSESIYAFSPSVTLVEKGQREPISGGLADFVNVGSFSSHLFGDLGSDKTKQVQQYFGAVAGAVRYRSQIIGKTPTAVRIGTKEEKLKSYHEQRVWQIRLKHFADGRGTDPGPLRESRWVSDIRRKSMAGTVRSHEEMEYLDNEHPLVRLLNDPNGPQTGEQFWPLVNAYLDLCGVSYIWVIPDRSGIPAAMWVVPASWVTENPRNRQTPAGQLIHSFSIAALGSAEIYPWDLTNPLGPNGQGGIIRLSVDSPLGPLTPDSRVFAHRFDVDMLGMIQSARYSGLQNGGEAGAVVEIDPDVTVNNDVMQRFLDQFQQRFAGVYNQNKPWFMPPGFRMNRGDSNREIALTQSEQNAWERVWEVFDLDYNALVKAGNSNYAAPAISRMNFRENVTMPRRRYIASVFTEKLCPIYGKDVRIVFEDSGGYVDPQERRANFHEAMNYPTGPAVTLNEVRKELLELEPYDDPIADQLWAKPGFISFDDLGQASSDTAGIGGLPAGNVSGSGADSEQDSTDKSDLINSLLDSLGGTIDDSEDAAKWLREILEKQSVEGIDSAGRKYRVVDGKRVPITVDQTSPDKSKTIEKVKALGKRVAKKAEELSVRLSNAVREKGLPVAKVNEITDSFLQTMAVKQFDMFHHHLGLDYQTTFEILTHVVAHVRHKIKTKLAESQKKEFNLFSEFESE